VLEGTGMCCTGASAGAVTGHLRAVAAVVAIGPDLVHAGKRLAAATAAAWCC
jgi:hypothetical protein